MTTTASDFQSQYDDPWDALADMHTRLEEKDDRINEQDEKIKELGKENQNQAERIDELEAELENQSTNIGGAFAKLSAIDDRLEAVEEGEGQGDQGEHEGDQDDGQTPLEQIIAMPYEAARNQLSTNIFRARYVAMSIKEVSTKTQKGFVVDSRTVRTVLSSSDLVDGRAHTETVSRVMDELETFGKDLVKSKTKCGKRRVAFVKELVARIEHGCCDRDQVTTPDDSVMIVG